MKKVFLLLGATFFYSFSFANTVESVFKKDSALSPKAQFFILQNINQNCKLGISPYGLFEQKSQIKNQEKSGNSQITTYSVQFESRYYHDGMHPSTQNLTAVFEEVLQNNQSEPEFNMLDFDGYCEAP